MRETARVTKTINGQLPRCSARCRGSPTRIREIPAETAEGTTTAYYNQGSPESGIAGTYYVNISQARTSGRSGRCRRSACTRRCPATISRSRSSRRWTSPRSAATSPSSPPSPKAGASMPRAWAATWASTTRPSGGWASFPTRCGARRRLVVDTGIHAFGWDKARAIAFMRDNTALTDANIEAEVNRYISWPGQALGYMIGRLEDPRAARAGPSRRSASASTSAASTTRC